MSRTHYTWVETSARNTRVSARQQRRLHALASHREWTVRFYVARNPTAPADALALLAQDREADIRLHVANHPNTPDALRVVALAANITHPASGVRSAVASSPYTPGELLEVLSGDTSATVRLTAATHPHLPAAAISRLATDTSPAVRDAIAGRADLTDEQKVLLALAGASTTPEEA